MNGKKHLILSHDSNWTCNVGNPFFTLGVKYVLDKCCTDSLVLSTASKTETGWPVRFRKRMRNDLNYINYSEPDWFVLSGPLLDKNLPRYYEEAFSKIFANGKTKLILLSAGGIQYDKQEIQTCRDFLTEYKPFALFTRDTVTYDNYHDLAEHSYDGICNAFYCADYYPGYPTDHLGDYIIAGFDNSKEPSFDLTGYTPENLAAFQSPTSAFKQINRLQMMMTENVPARSGNFTIVRPNHNIMRLPIHFLLRKPNTFVSQTPFGYLNLYRNSRLTLTDRIHACVATLAYGNPARLYTQSDRSYLLNRVGAGSAKIKPTLVETAYLKEEKRKLLDRLSQVYSESKP